MKGALELRGVAAAEGLAEGPAFFWRAAEPQVKQERALDSLLERSRLTQALQLAEQQLLDLAQQLEAKTSASEAAVLRAQSMFLTDPGLLAKAEEAIAGGATAAAAWHAACEFFARQLEQLPDATLSARAVDVRDTSRRVILLLAGESSSSLPIFETPVVLLAQDLTPSQTAGLEKSQILALCTAEGGPTSHTAILARALGIPAVVGLGSKLDQIADGTMLIVDGGRGKVIADPDPLQLEDLRRRIAAALDERKADRAAAGKPAVTIDQRKVEIYANVGSLADAKRASELGADGIGLLRTEFLFLRRNSAPSLAEQTEAYRTILEAMPGRPVIVRTLDAGADKELGYLNQPIPTNPALSRRGIRLTLAEPELFEMQLQALIEAGRDRDMRIMFPMIATLTELNQALEAFEAAKAKSNGGDQIRVGIMVEVPSAVWQADELAARVDFFSIGTNDLTQYSFAADRTDASVAYLNEGLHPVILRQVDAVVKAAHRHGAEVGVCGELAGRREAIPLLVGLNIDELSMSPAAIPAAKRIVRKLVALEASKLAEHALSLASAAEVTLASNEFLDQLESK